MPAVSASAQRKSTMASWLATEFTFTHFVTLATNDNTLSPAVLRRRLRNWDARVNRRLYGQKWQKHADDALWYFAFLEKPASNPHWHLLLRLVGRWGEDPLGDIARFSRTAASTWRDVTPSGTTNVQQIRANTYKTVSDYVAKELRGELQYSSFVTPDEFRRFVSAQG